MSQTERSRATTSPAPDAVVSETTTSTPILTQVTESTRLDTYTWPVAQRRCPLVKAAWRIGDPDVVAVVARVHPPVSCPAARRHRHFEAVAG